MVRALIRYGVAAAALLFAVQASATVNFFTGLEGGSGDVENVLLDGGVAGGDAGTFGPGTTVKGSTNQSDLVVVFESMVEDIIIVSGGQARIEGDDNSGDDDGGETFDDIMISLEDPTLGFTKIQFNIDSLADTDVLITAHWIGPGGPDDEVSSGLTLDDTGENFFTAISSDGQIMTKITIETDELDMLKLEQVRLFAVERNGTPVTPVPEPSTALLLGIGFLLAGVARTRRRV